VKGMLVLVLINAADWLHEADQLSAPSAKVWGKCMEVYICAACIVFDQTRLWRIPGNKYSF